MRRREFLTLIGSAVAGNPLAAHAQQTERARRVVVLMGAAETSSSRRRLTSFIHRLNELGWSERRNLSTSRSPEVYRSCSSVSAIQSAVALFPVLLILARTSLVSLVTIRRWVASGWRCSRRLRPISAAF